MVDGDVFNRAVSGECTNAIVRGRRAVVLDAWPRFFKISTRVDF